MPEPILDYVPCADPWGGHRMAYWQWGDARAEHLIVCVHGLSRQGRDFDVLARALLARAGRPLRVVCPDVVGRGRSDWLKEPMGYQIPLYSADMLALLAQLHGRHPLRSLDWLGTSMGGLIGLGLCGTPELRPSSTPPAPAALPRLPVPVRRLVLNDVGPTMQWQALARIGQNLGQLVRFDSVEQGAEFLRINASTFGPHTPAQWLAHSRGMLKALPEGGFTLHYDPAIGLATRAVDAQALAQGEALLWSLYDNIQARTLLLRGADSDLLSRATAQAMTQRGPRARLIEFAGVGHAPTLIADDQVDAVTSFLLEPGA